MPGDQRGARPAPILWSDRGARPGGDLTVVQKKRRQAGASAEVCWARLWGRPSPTRCYPREVNGTSTAGNGTIGLPSRAAQHHIGLPTAAPETDQAGRANRAPQFRCIPSSHLSGVWSDLVAVTKPSGRSREHAVQGSCIGVAERGATTRSFGSRWRIYSRRRQDKGRLVNRLQPGTRNSSIQAFPFQLCRIPWNIYDWIMLDFAVNFDNSSYGKRSICILACVFAVDFGNRIIPGFGLYRCLRQKCRPTSNRESRYD